MRIVLGLCLLILNFTTVFSQDIIVLRKTEEEIKCNILSVDDSLLIYKLWKSQDKSSHNIRRYDVLSFMIAKSSNETNNSDIASLKKDDTGILGEYETGNLVNGYVIKENNDTITGKIRIYNFALNQVEVKFIYDSGDSALFTTSDIKAYGYMGVVYEKCKTGYKGKITNDHKRTDGTQFLHCVINGNSKLYYFYKLKFRKGVFMSYDGNPPYYFGKINRQFLITNPKGQRVFTKGRTIKGSINLIYFDYQEYFSNYPLKNPNSSKLPLIVTNFNNWYSNKN